MSEKKHEILPGVGCDVTSCKFNTVESRCCAGTIRVRGEKAETKGETCCSTFCPRGSC